MSANTITVTFDLDDEEADILQGDFKRMAEEAEEAAKAATRKIRRNKDKAPSCQHYWDEAHLQDTQLRARVLHQLSDEINERLIEARQLFRSKIRAKAETFQIVDAGEEIF